MAAEWVTQAALIPDAKPTPIPGMEGTVGQFFGYGLWLVVLGGVGGAGYGVFKLGVSDKRGHGGSASEPFKWMGGGAAAVVLAGTLIAILNGIAGG
ncbi:hypothetical protein G6048_00105 [Streptomyces sp. YC419]|uniref:DUF4190 domain-containing protein n=2 Tax=Streptomyces ureilyticus TaxID=1775131 RepID=A0ABX0DIN6_9ACTN|nr:hypothetical protein [Streptomyces ureilyticus]